MTTHRNHKAKVLHLHVVPISVGSSRNDESALHCSKNSSHQECNTKGMR